MGRPALTVDGDQFAYSAKPVIRGRIKAPGRQDVLTMREQEASGPLGRFIPRFGSTVVSFRTP